MDIEFEARCIYTNELKKGDYVRRLDPEVEEIVSPKEPVLKHFIVDWRSGTWEHYEVDPMTLQQTKYLDR